MRRMNRLVVLCFFLFHRSLLISFTFNISKSFPFSSSFPNGNGPDTPVFQNCASYTDFFASSNRERSAFQSSAPHTQTMRPPGRRVARAGSPAPALKRTSVFEDEITLPAEDSPEIQERYALSGTTFHERETFQSTPPCA